MRTPNLVRASACGAASLLAATITHAAPPPTVVTVGNTPLPVQVTNASIPVSGTVNATFSGTPTVSATVTNTATNPVAVTNSDRPTAFHQRAFLSAAGGRTVVPIPTGCRLVVQAISMDALDPTAGPHVPLLEILSPTQALLAIHSIPTQQVTVLGVATINGTLVIQLFVDYTDKLAVVDLGTVVDEFFSISGYLLPLTPGASC